MPVRIDTSWQRVLAPEFSKPYFKELTAYVKNDYATTAVYPPPKEIFSAFNACPFDRVKVVILGQDPYHGVHQAHGLAFSVRSDIAIPPSLQNIFKEIHTDVGAPIPKTGDLTHWAAQGVLLLNATLTVRKGQPGSHQNKGWEEFTSAAVKTLSDNREHVVFLLWGSYAKQKGEIIDRARHVVLTAPHPSPFSADRGFFGCKHFSTTNAYLTKHGIEPIVWG